MLVLTRKKSEMINIGDEIIVKIIQTGRTTVKIGIEAPENVRVLRAEVVPPDSSAGVTLRDLLQERRTAKRGQSCPQ